MNTSLKQIGQKWLIWMTKNPKKFYVSCVIFLSVSFLASMIQGIFFPSETIFRIKPPILYSQNQPTKKQTISQEKDMEKIVNELKGLKIKRDRNALQKQDSLRIEYLYNQYQQLKK
ncbi:hypothetical protein [Chryseobacterium sp. MFBS3-17]|uniref:hypothetical protein n=1 Tax=Chryseobacterium sp. MFBS3-17 TaxID=2886689 RepID=UPI001D0E84D2|nr:hypothetical protein [Chryseobacterium sp. MFBS3-17]MCC2590386.1 hypothetical protein [Chryseobacterium sp. MFBS3-17]